jgi:hypothetical protein
MIIGYKGFDKDLKCREVQFTVGDIASKPYIEKPRLCTGDGFHYCKQLREVFAHYGLDGLNRYCEIEVLGGFTESKDKCITTSFRIIRELSKKEVEKVIADEKDHKIGDRLNLETIKELQERYPIFHVGGSAGLFLHGIRLKRWEKANTSSDLDLIAPYYILVEDPEGDVGMVEHLDAKASANDFDETFLYDGVKVDLRIDPKQRYEYITYQGFRYKVSNLFTILEAKMRYALNGQGKHKADLMEMMTAGFDLKSQMFK